ncbi:hypothetical protein MTX35_06350 [Rhodococcus sp. ARC_M12]|uniref:hypothetical protein n=1 Tax=unclassified Rhodococcus (in: high G+C Gram-positive bacteria) TaxID=192944 RepID=UPI001FB1CF82|nr:MULTISPECIES: hypothetical protein [unclassified Rhodococcus (in: high G+C Gram-positive bacteria)]MCJ0893108.1 hypothetical protein [Rhodococcus sp. ARC_M5]MCJ0977317.1 hypothetical protein [Rhodococcus sp. ARC_M12]
MNRTGMNHPHTPPDRRETSSQGITLGTFIADGMRLGPAPTRGREAVAAIGAVVALGIVLGVLQPGVIVSAVAAGAGVAIFAVRWIVGTRKWGQR